MLRRVFLCIAATTVVLGAASTAANAQLFSISGTVSDQLTAPVANVNVILFDNVGNPIGIPLTVTDAFGFYSISGLPAGAYEVGFEPVASTKLLPKNVPVVVIGSTALNVTLDPGNLVSGFVRDSTGVGIVNIDLKVENKDTGVILNTPNDDTDSTGFYAIVIPDGDFFIKWRAVDPLSPPWISVEIREIITADTTFDVTMIIGVFVSGTIVNQSAIPLSNVNLDFIDSATGNKLTTPGDNTDLLGHYQVHVPTASYDVRVKPLAPTGLQGLEVLNIPVNGDTTLDFAVQPGVRLSGRVTDSILAGVFNVDVDVNDAATGAAIYTPFDKTDSFGNYQVVVPSGLCDVTYEPPVITQLAPVAVTSVPVANDTTINIAVVTGVLLSGIVIDSGGLPVSGVDIDAKDSLTRVDIPLVGDHTDGLGIFTVVIAPGTYDIQIEPAKALRLVAEEMLSQPLVANTTLLIGLSPGVSVSGLVTDFVGTFFPGVNVSAFPTAGGLEIFTPGSSTNSQGRYEIIVPADSYTLLYKPVPATGVLDSIQLDNQALGSDAVINVEFNVSIATGIMDGQGTPQASVLHPNYPNPFNPSTIIRYELPRSARVSLVVYDVTGARVRVLDRGPRPAGLHEVQWHGRDESGHVVSTGVYFFRLTADGRSMTQKMLLLK